MTDEERMRLVKRRTAQIDRVKELRELYDGPDPEKDPEWWFDTSNFDGDPVELF